MHTLQTILETLRPGDFLTSINLTEVYLHVPIHPDFRKYLRFHYRGCHYQYAALPFGLSSTPRVFTKIMAALVAHIRSTPLRIQFYLDDILLQSSSLRAVRQDLATTIRIFQDHGFSVNWSKSHLVPTTCLQHLGAVINTVTSTVSLSVDRQTSLCSMALRCISERSSSLLGLSCLMGKMVSTYDIVPWSRLHSRELQWFLLPHQKNRSSTSLRRVSLPPAVISSLRWWTSSALSAPCFFREPTRHITMDASLQGCEAHLKHHLTQGQWSTLERSLPINLLELRAIHLALLHFQNLITSCDVLVLTDNVTAKAHVNRLGGTHSRVLMDEALLLGLWAESHLKSLRADHISGEENSQADALSRHQLDNAEWSLPAHIFRDITLCFGTPEVDLFASRTNHQVPRVIRKVIQEWAEIILLAPRWPRRHWYADLVSLSVDRPWSIPDDQMILLQGPLRHPDPSWYRLTAWRLSGSS
ncbi:uncharacterized protein LOC132710188 [Pantherophis guttatus]|uniref:ribonuclease H n=1 Tax=Pantherophis guttatus TaxID=94885 RepID=A0ABM3Z0F2_PANGU|nr:uncharacterized protein LOC132710188 [Pantherophis guttatus]